MLSTIAIFLLAILIQITLLQIHFALTAGIIFTRVFIRMNELNYYKKPTNIITDSITNSSKEIKEISPDEEDTTITKENIWKIQH